MDCKYCEVGPYDSYCICQKQHGKDPICPHVWRCSKLMIWKPLPAMEKCPLRHENGNVAMARHGYLYVDIDGQIVKLLNPFDYVPDNVDVCVVDGHYEIKE